VLKKNETNDAFCSPRFFCGAKKLLLVRSIHSQKQNYMLKRLLFFGLFLFSITLCAQNLARNIVSSAGGNFSNPNVSVAYTIGETVVGSLGNGVVAINQGFQQADETTTVGVTTFLDATQILVYPNPTTNSVKVDLHSAANIEVRWELVDAAGQVSLSSPSPIVGSTTIDFTGLPSAMYYLVLRNTATGAKQGIPIVKK